MTAGLRAFRHKCGICLIWNNFGCLFVIYGSLNDAGSSSGYLLRLKNKAKGMQSEAFLAWFEVAPRIFLGDATASSHSSNHWSNHEMPPPTNPQPYPLDGDLNQRAKSWPAWIITGHISLQTTSTTCASPYETTRLIKVYYFLLWCDNVFRLVCTDVSDEPAVSIFKATAARYSHIPSALPTCCFFMRVHLKVSCRIGSDVTSNDKVKEAVAVELRNCTGTWVVEMKKREISDKTAGDLA